MRILVNGTEISQDWIDEMIPVFQNNLSFEQDEDDLSPEVIRKRAEDHVIDQELISQYLQSSSSPYPDPTEKRIQIELRQHPDYYNTFQPEAARAKAVLLIKRGMLEKDIKAKIPTLPEAEYQKFYDSHPEAFVHDAGYMVTKIDFYLDQEDSPSAADAMIKLIELKSGIEQDEHPEAAWFRAMFAESDSYSEDISENFYVFTKKELSGEIAGKLDSAAPGNICGPFFSDLDTVSLFRLEAKTPRKKFSLEEGKGLILKSWHHSQKLRLYKELAGKLRENAKIEYLDD